MKLGRLNHVGVATPDVEAAAKVYADLYGVTDRTEAKDFPNLGVRVVFVTLPNMQIELIEPLGDQSPIHKFLEKNPKGGQHHMCFEVADIIKVDIHTMTAAQVARQVELLRGHKAKLMAEKVETHEEYQLCRDLGFDFFQVWSHLYV